jgi:hypothetical protein
LGVLFRTEGSEGNKRAYLSDAHRRRPTRLGQGWPPDGGRGRGAARLVVAAREEMPAVERRKGKETAGERKLKAHSGPC